ncbi:UNVERIFIED_CONTAM: Tetratricopeptide repeat protein 8 [Gekko kuhli]
MVYVDEIDVDQEGIAEMMLDENAIAQVARPGTSLKLPGTSQGGGPSQAVRPVTQTGRPITGFVRPSTQSGRPGTMEQAIKTPRTAHAARPMTSASGRYVRLGTASLLTNPDGPFLNVAKLNLNNYAQKPKLAKGSVSSSPEVFSPPVILLGDKKPPGVWGEGQRSPARGSNKR